MCYIGNCSTKEAFRAAAADFALEKSFVESPFRTHFGSRQGGRLLGDRRLGARRPACPHMRCPSCQRDATSFNVLPCGPLHTLHIFGHGPDRQEYRLNHVLKSACTVKVPIRWQSEPDYTNDVYQPLAALAGPAHDNDDPAPAAGDDPVPAPHDDDPATNDDPPALAGDDPVPAPAHDDDPASNDKSLEVRVLEMLIMFPRGQTPEPKPVQPTVHEHEFWEELANSVCMFSLHDIDRTGFLRRNT